MRPPPPVALKLVYSLECVHRGPGLLSVCCKMIILFSESGRAAALPELVHVTASCIYSLGQLKRWLKLNRHLTLTLARPSRLKSAENEFCG